MFQNDLSALQMHMESCVTQEDPGFPGHSQQGSIALQVEGWHADPASDILSSRDSLKQARTDPGSCPLSSTHACNPCTPCTQMRKIKIHFSFQMKRNAMYKFPPAVFWEQILIIWIEIP